MYLPFLGITILNPLLQKQNSSGHFIYFLRGTETNLSSNCTNGKELLALLLGATEFLDGGQCRVWVERPQDIAKVEGIDFATAVEVVDGVGEGCPCDWKIFILDLVLDWFMINQLIKYG